MVYISSYLSSAQIWHRSRQTGSETITRLKYLLFTLKPFGIFFTIIIFSSYLMSKTIIASKQIRPWKAKTGSEVIFWKHMDGLTKPSHQNHVTTTTTVSWDSLESVALNCFCIQQSNVEKLVVTWQQQQQKNLCCVWLY